MRYWIILLSFFILSCSDLSPESSSDNPKVQRIDSLFVAEIRSDEMQMAVDDSSLITLWAFIEKESPENPIVNLKVNNFSARVDSLIFLISRGQVVKCPNFILPSDSVQNQFWYVLRPDELRRMSQADILPFRIIGDRPAEGVIDPGALAMMRQFYAELIK